VLNTIMMQFRSMSIPEENSGTLLKDSKFGMALNVRRYSVGLGHGDLHITLIFLR
jgi:hypothetical protein